MKSFSELTKEELYKTDNLNSCCDAAEFGGMLLMGCSISCDEIKLVTENPDVLGCFAMLARRLGYSAEIGQAADKASRYSAGITDPTQIFMILSEYLLIDSDTRIIKHKIARHIVENDCCRRAFVRGAFLGGGTVIDPKKNYNRELVTPYMGLSRDICELLRTDGFTFKTVVRKSKYVIYIKNSETIQDFLSYMGAYKAQMELINVKIEKEIRNDVTRSINSETANYEKTIGASVKQIQAIEEIQKFMKLDDLPDELREIARLRLKYKSMSLTELGDKCTPKLGKSGVNHRMKKILALAEKLKTKPE